MDYVMILIESMVTELAYAALGLVPRVERILARCGARLLRTLQAFQTKLT